MMLFVIFAVEVLITSLLLFISVILLYYCDVYRKARKCSISFAGIPTPIIGNFNLVTLLRTNVGVHFKQSYEHIKKRGIPAIGIFLMNQPKVLVSSPAIAKEILQRRFDHFNERGFYYNEKDDPLSANLFALGGAKWKTLRTKLSPAYTPGKLKAIFHGLVKCAEQMQKEVENRTSVDFKEVFECFTIDVIGCCAFGIECNSFKNPESEFRKQGKKVFYFNIPRVLKVTFALVYKDAARWLGVTLFDENTTRFFISVVKDSLEYRKNNIAERKDFLEQLLELNKDEQTFSLEELTAQVFIFFAAGFETSSITLTFCLYELCLNPHVQEKLRSEITETLSKDENLSYNTVTDMKYLGQVVDETLRKYPPVSYITRTAVKDYQLPGTDITIERGIDVIIPILGIHHDPEYYPDPEKFDPERFSEENKAKRVPFTYMPFGEGPRICIGQRFGLMQVKVGLAVLLKNFRFTLNEKTPVPLEMEPYSFTLTPKGGVFLDVEKLISPGGYS